MNMAKYRKLQQEMEGAVERADMAENTLGQLRARNRSASVAPENTTTFGLTVNYSCLGNRPIRIIFIIIIVYYAKMAAETIIHKIHTKIQRQKKQKYMIK